MDTLIALDREILLAINQGLGSKLIDPVMIAFTYLGYGWVAAPLLALVVWRVGRRRFWAYAIAFIIALGGGGMLSQVVKRLVDRPRPAASLVLASPEQHAIRLPHRPLARHSFPSGHAQLVFAAAVLLSFLRRRWLAPAFILALLVGLSRVYLGVHYPTDVVAGALLGVAIALPTVFLARRQWGLFPPSV